MRTVSFTINTSLDGYCDHTAFNPGKDMMDYFTGTMDDVDLLFYGRIMYQLMFPYWADVARQQSGTVAENRFAERLVAIDKVVVSRSLEKAEHNTQIIRSNPAGALMKLKQGPGKKISVDTISMLPQLIDAGLIDEFNIVVHPIIVGKGRPLMDNGSLAEKLNLQLTNSVVFQSGHVALEYRKV